MTSAAAQQWASVAVMVLMALGMVIGAISNYRLKKKLNRARIKLTEDYKKTVLDRSILAEKKGETNAKATKDLDDRVDMLNDVLSRL